MKIPRKARYGYCVKKACEFLEEFEIASYPIDVISIITKRKWGLTAYSELMELYNCDRDTVCRCLRSIDGYSQQDTDNVSIAYNDDPTYGDRIRFTLMHEIGHVYLNHFIDFDLTLLHREPTEKENRVLENEANAFARNVLAPLSMVNQLKDKSFKNVSYTFGITHDASVTRVSLLPNDLYYSKQQNLTKRMNSIFFKFYNKTVCNNCNAFFYTRHKKYCLICGSKNTLQWGDGKMNYQNWDVDENGRVLTCITCGNETLIGSFCQICGSPVENKCTDNLYNNDFNPCPNSNLLPANARYCHECGSESLFMRRNMLCTWQEELRKIEEQEKLENKISFMTIPDDIDEELPFPISNSNTSLPDGIDEELPFT